MAATELLWDSPVEIAQDGNVGGLLHYFNEWAQVIYSSADDRLRTRTAFVAGGEFPSAQFNVEQYIDGGLALTGMRFDHPCFGQVFGVWCNEGTLVFALYSYAAQISDIVENAEITEKVDNTIRSLALSVKNADSLMFEDDISLFCPGAALDLEMTMGESSQWYPMGKYYLDKSPFDPLSDSFSLQARSRSGRLLKDTTFDTYFLPNRAQFSGTAAQIVTEILLLYGDGEIDEADIIVQENEDTFSATFKPEKRVLDGLVDWLSGKDTTTAAEHDTLEYGDTGSEVALAQTLVNKALPISYTKLVVDGVFGDKTRAAVRYIQALKGITVNGSVDAPTWAALLIMPLNWKLLELYDGRFVVGQPAFIAAYKPVGRYTFTRGTDVLTRSIDRCADGCYSRVGVSYKSEGEDAYVYAGVDMWPAWAVPSHKTFYMSASDDATQAQAQTIANNKAVALQYVGVTEQVVGPIRPELLVGDIALVDNGDETATVTGLITSIRHKLGSSGFYTTFTTDSGGAIMEDTLEGVPVEVSAMSAVWGGANRQRKIADLIRDISSS